MNDRTRNPVERQLMLARAAYTPSPALRARVLERLQPAPLPAVAATRAGHTGWRALRESGLKRALLGAGLLALGFVAGYQAHANRELPPPPPLPQLEVTSAEALIPEVEPLPEPLAVDVPRAPVQVIVPRARKVRPRAPAASARDELALLARAERAVRADNSALALALIAELEERHPRSRLLEERRAIELMAHCAASATDGALRAQRFVRKHPRSVYAERIAELCQAGAPAASPRL